MNRVIAALLVILAPSVLLAAERVVPGTTPSGEVQLPNGRMLTPTGLQTPVTSYPFALAVVPGGSRLVVASTGASDQSLQLLDAKTGKLLHSVAVRRSWLGLALSEDGARAYLAGAKEKKLHVFRIENDKLMPEPAIPVTTPEDGKKDALPSGLAVSPDGKLLFAARVLADDVVKIDLASGKVVATFSVGKHPYRPVFTADGKILAVTNWGGASVTLLDPATGRILATIPTEDHPTDAVFSRDGRWLFVAEANRNRVAAIDVAARKEIRQIAVALGPDGPGSPSADLLPDGSTPNALALAPDGRTLFVANADDDAVAVVEIEKDLAASRATGFIPSGWYPDALGLSPDGKTLFIANGKGSGSRPNAKDGPVPTKPYKGTPPGHIEKMPGSVSIVGVPSKKELASLTVRAYANRKPAARGLSPARSSGVIPSRPGEASPIKYVVYVIRENRTYDQVLGDLPKGNGDPSLVLFGRDVTPNAHALAEEFVLLDNFYADAEVSADGHNWSMAAYATDFVEKVWPLNYAGNGWAYVFEGDEPNAAPTAGYLWDSAAKAGVTLRNYGEFLGIGAESPDEKYTGRFEGKGENLAPYTCPFFPGFDLEILDNSRVDLWLKEFREFEKKGEMPRLQIVRLGDDHTSGTKKGAKTPRAFVADNDLALGRLIETLSNSKFWKETAVFVVEDDAQNGSDHVDSHRTVALAISPWTRRGGAVDSTMYSTTSMLRTMELILGLPPMSQHDAAATPMSNAFADSPDVTPYRHRPAEVPLYETNPDGAPMQALMEGWDFSREDAAPDIDLNEAIWKSVKGEGVPMPTPVNAAFVRVRGETDGRR
ncbi:MAG: beta-propeller fold lactonase family protein [Thermoanaerobaculia bacterium]